MKTYKYIAFVLLLFPLLFSCDEESDKEEEPKRTTQLITLENSTGTPGLGCGPADGGMTVTFLITYSDIQVSANIQDRNFGFVNVLVEDGERIQVKVLKTSDDTLLADSSVSVRTDSRPSDLEGRTIEYCTAFALKFHNF